MIVGVVMSGSSSGDDSMEDAVSNQLKAVGSPEYRQKNDSAFDVASRGGEAGDARESGSDPFGSDTMTRAAYTQLSLENMLGALDGDNGSKGGAVSNVSTFSAFSGVSNDAASGEPWVADFSQFNTPKSASSSLDSILRGSRQTSNPEIPKTTQKNDKGKGEEVSSSGRYAMELGDDEIVVTPAVTMISLVIKYGVSATRIRKHNKLWDDNDIHTRKTLRIPGFSRINDNAASPPAASKSNSEKSGAMPIERRSPSDAKSDEEGQEEEEEDPVTPTRSASYYDAIAVRLRDSQQKKLQLSMFDDL